MDFHSITRVVGNSPFSDVCGVVKLHPSLSWIIRKKITYLLSGATQGLNICSQYFQGNQYCHLEERHRFSAPPYGFLCMSHWTMSGATQDIPKLPHNNSWHIPLHLTTAVLPHYHSEHFVRIVDTQNPWYTPSHFSPKIMDFPRFPTRLKGL